MPRHATRTSFRKGASGNPGGRPKLDPRVRDLARQHTEDALAALVTVMENPKTPPATVIRAAEAILDRGWGKPLQQDELYEMTARDAIESDSDGSVRHETWVRRLIEEYGPDYATLIEEDDEIPEDPRNGSA